MFCFKCGKRLPAKVVNCPDCDTPQKRRQRYRRRMFLGLFIFLAGAVCGSLFDTIFFQGKAWNHSFMGVFSAKNADSAVDNIQATKVDPSDVPSNIDNTEFAGPVDYKKAYEEADPIEATASEALLAASENASSATMNIESTAPSEADELATELPGGVAASHSENILPEPQTDESVNSASDKKLVFTGLEAVEKTSGSNYHGSLSQNGTEYIFSSNREKIDGKNTYQCYIKGGDLKKNAKKLFAWPGNVWTPELTPDSQTVIFSSDSVKAEHIFAYDRSTGESRQLTDGTDKNMMPCISPDGKMIVFVSNRSGANGIWLMGIDGGNLLQLTSGKEDDREPRWTNGGRSIVFTRIFQAMKKSQIMQMQLDPMGEPEAIVGTNERNWLGDISADGSTLAFVRSLNPGGSKNRIIIRNIKSGQEKVLDLLNGAECFRPVWNFDGNALVFHAAQGSSRNIYLARFAQEKSN